VALAVLAVFIGSTCSAQPLTLDIGTKGDPASLATQLLEASGVQGGLIVHVGCGDGQLPAALQKATGSLVHGLATEPASLEQARRHIEDAGNYGRVSVELFHGGKLPYVDNLVNLLVVDQPEGLSTDEMMRVLAPGGAACVRRGQSYTVRVKPWPESYGQWTHFLHGPDNNAVTNDRAVGPPKHMQWVAGPKWARCHEMLASVSAVVSDAGRIFYIADEGPIASVDLPSRWVLVARDAFNGVELWRKEIDLWETQLRPFRSGPPDLPRRMVAIDNTLYVTLGYYTPVSALNAATGAKIRDYPETEGAEEILFSEGVLYVVLGDLEGQRAADAAVRQGKQPEAISKSLVAVQAATGQVLWQKADADTSTLLAQTLAVDGRRAFFQNTEEIVCLDAGSGRVLWRTPRAVATRRPAWSVPTLVVHGGVLISADRAAPKAAELKSAEKPRKPQWNVSFGGGNAPQGEMIGYSVETGEELWRTPCRECYNAPVDVLVDDGLVWSGELVRARDPGITEARDLESGEVARTRPDDHEFLTPGMSHHRCYRNKATDRFLLLGRSGVEMVDVETGEAIPHHWIRGTCQYGILACNGLLYAPPHTCACYIRAKLNGFNALAAARDHETPASDDSAEKGEAKYGDSQQSDALAQLQTGPEYEAWLNGSPNLELDTSAWPTYRHDAARSGASARSLAGPFVPDWQHQLSGPLSAPVVAGGRVLVASVDAHTVHALSAKEGQPAWSFTAGGRIDSPPTIAGEAVVFGSADGWVYCLRAADGEMLWRYHAGPELRRVVSYNQLESAWPAHGSVLVLDDNAYFAAGRSSFLDEGIFLCRLDLKSGKLLDETRICHRDPETGHQPRELVRGFEMAGALPDVLSSDGEYIYMRHLKFNREGVHQDEPSVHLFSPTGFLDDSWWHRSYWLYGDQFVAGWGGWWRAGNRTPAGRILAVDDTTIYGFGRNYFPGGNAGQWRTGEAYRVFATDKQQAAERAQEEDVRRGKIPGRESVPATGWSHPAEVEARALVLAGDVIILAGPTGDTRHDVAAFEGREGIELRTLSAADGKLISKQPLQSLPVFDGMAVAGSRLYLCTRDGQVRCFGLQQ
jgi:outer membrane protein assembly factor BamB